MDFKGLVSSRDLFGFDVQPLPDVARSVSAQRSFNGYVSCNQDFLSVGKFKQAQAARITRSAHLDSQRSRNKECAESECEGRTNSAAQEIRCRSCEDDPRHQPPKRRPPCVDTGREASRVCQRRPKQRLSSARP